MPSTLDRWRYRFSKMWEVEGLCARAHGHDDDKPAASGGLELTVNWWRRFGASVRSPPNDFSRCRLAVGGSGASPGRVRPCGSDGSGVDRRAASSSSSYYSSSALEKSPLPPPPPDLRRCEQTSVSSAAATGHRRIHKIPSNGISFRFQRGNVMRNRFEKKEKKRKETSAGGGAAKEVQKQKKKSPWHRLNTLRDNGGAPAGCHSLEQCAAVPNAPDSSS